MPAPALKTADITTNNETQEAEDPMTLPFSIAVLLAAIFAVVTAFIVG